MGTVRWLNCGRLSTRTGYSTYGLFSAKANRGVRRARSWAGAAAARAGAGAIGVAAAAGRFRAQSAAGADDLPSAARRAGRCRALGLLRRVEPRSVRQQRARHASAGAARRDSAARAGAGASQPAQLAAAAAWGRSRRAGLLRRIRVDHGAAGRPDRPTGLPAHRRAAGGADRADPGAAALSIHALAGDAPTRRSAGGRVLGYRGQGTGKRDRSITYHLYRLSPIAYHL